MRKLILLAFLSGVVTKYSSIFITKYKETLDGMIRDLNIKVSDIEEDMNDLEKNIVTIEENTGKYENNIESYKNDP